MSDSFNGNPIFDRRLETIRPDKDRFFSQMILGFLALSALYFIIGVIRSLLS